ncbi:hypothetical protein [Pedobacter sp.]|uniref:hypothetical protein n=1 Tax=Pedobacter sp. TaxID=1411316 RepID=UPI003D7FBA9F
MENKETPAHHAGDEKIGNEEEEKKQNADKSDLKLKGLDDKRPADEDLPKGWTPDSDTSRGPEDLK